MSKAAKVAILAVIAILLLFGGQLISFYTNWLWFKEVGYLGVFNKIILTKFGIALAAGIIFFVFVGLNLWFARRAYELPKISSYDVDYRFKQRAGVMFRKGIGWLIVLGLVIASLFAALIASDQWSSFLRFVNATPFGVKDPVFRNDISLYVFKLPFWNYLYSWSISTLILTTIAVAIIYYSDKALDFLAGSPRIDLRVRVHLLTLLGIFLVIKGIGYRLDAYQLLFSNRGASFGAAYSDIHARLPLLNLLMVAAFVAALLVFVSTRIRSWKLPAAAVVGLILISALAGAGYPEFIQRFQVKPNELEKERPYIQRTIQFTRQAFGINSIQMTPFTATGTLTAADIAQNPGTIQNIRLWDYRPLASTYQNLQAIRPYYSLKGPEGIDIDRYMVDGRLRQVMLAARELSGTDQIESSWVRNRLQYTHGYGVVMSPTSEVTSDGLPRFYISGIPINKNTPVPLTQPRIYYGELTDKYIITRADQPEFDYPSGTREATTRYDGKGGVPLNSFIRRALYAASFQDLNLILSGAINSDSRILYRRQISERLRTLAPFLVYDRDPYLAISNGRLVWIQDAYTVSTAYPYSEPHQMDEVAYPINYVRNSVKATVDAYDGTVRFYVADPKDPIIRTYRKIFPSLFKDIKQMPAALRSHIRYPEDLFRLQANVYATYHMTNPTIFYRKEDVWNFPKEVHSDQQTSMAGSSSETQPTMEPYYVIMKLPGETREEFILILPFTPPNRPNMIAWMAAKSNLEDYGKLIVYEFPELAYGPEQVEARIDQDTRISQELTLWDQSGSRVIRGNLLVIPIQDSLLYVEPLYLQSTGSDLPELKRVIVAYGNQVAMEPTFGEALGSVFGRAAAGTAPTTGAPSTQPKPTPKPGAAAPPGDVKSLVAQANQNFQRAQDAQRRGDWAAYGDELKRLQSTLNELQQRTR